MTLDADVIDFASIRVGLAELPRASNHAPGEPVEPSSMLILPEHRVVLDFDRPLVVGNRGMGKSFWAHALVDPSAKTRAIELSPQLKNIDVVMGFNASERVEPVAPTPTMIQDALTAYQDPDLLWRAVLARVAVRFQAPLQPVVPADSFISLVAWVQQNGERVDRLLTEFDDTLVASNRRVLVVFDALDRLGANWQTTRELTTALLKRALAVRSYRAIRLKLFMRTDQFEDQAIFQFPDGSKVKNTRVDIKWQPDDLYKLIFARISQNPASTVAFEALRTASKDGLLMNAIAGEFMGATKKRGRVYTWLPLHLSDARGETSPRTFLTAWREAAKHEPPPKGRAIDHLGLIEGVRKASEDRLQELSEDYWWIKEALGPLKGEMVPMEKGLLFERWRTHATVQSIRESSSSTKLPPVQLENSTTEPEAALLLALIAIGIVEERSNGKINVPDIFRVEAGIKRKGGVKPPQRSVGG